MAVDGRLNFDTKIDTKGFNEAIDKKDDIMVFYNCYDMEDVACKYIEETGMLDDVPEHLANYFDYESFGRDMSFNGHFVFTGNGSCIQTL